MKISGNLVDLSKGMIYPAELTVYDGRIESVEEIENAQNQFIMPGMVDAHVHVESSMVTPSHFAVAAIKHGTVAVVSDPHEIANVLGIKGVKFMLDNSETVPLKFNFGAPSCVPATPFESSGAILGLDEIKILLNDERIGFIAEMMNFPGVIFNDSVVIEKLDLGRKRKMVIDGHAPGLSGTDLRKYVEAGISTDHECSTLKEATEKLSLGMKILIREGSAAQNLRDLAPLIGSHPDMVMLCSDDLHPETLEERHINSLVARLIRQGYDIFSILKAACVNAVKHYGLNVGLLNPGDPADFIIVDNPASMNVLETWIDGRCVYDGKHILFSPGTAAGINNFNCNRITESEIRVLNTGKYMRVIIARNGVLHTGSIKVPTGNEHYVSSRPEDDILKLVVKDRYRDAPPAVAFIKGFGLRSGALAASVAHDSHNIIAVGTADRLLVRAINMIVDAEGGMAAASDSESGILKLPVAGIMSDMPVSATAARYKQLNEMVKQMGCTMDAPYMTLSFMALLVIPELKLSDRGLFDVMDFKHVPLFLE